MTGAGWLADLQVGGKLWAGVVVVCASSGTTTHKPLEPRWPQVLVWESRETGDDGEECEVGLWHVKEPDSPFPSFSASLVARGRLAMAVKRESLACAQFVLSRGGRPPPILVLSPRPSAKGDNDIRLVNGRREAQYQR